MDKFEIFLSFIYEYAEELIVVWLVSLLTPLIIVLIIVAFRAAFGGVSCPEIEVLVR